jgi:hypothetical protein
MAIDTHDDEAAARELLAAAKADTSPLGRKARRKRLANIIILIRCVLLTPFLVYASVTRVAKPGLDIDLAAMALLPLSAANFLLFAATVTSLARVNDDIDDIDDIDDMAAFAIRWAASMGDKKACASVSRAANLARRCAYSAF